MLPALKMVRILLIIYTTCTCIIYLFINACICLFIYLLLYIVFIYFVVIIVGSVRVNDLESNKLLCHSKYTSGGSSLIWAPLSVDPNGLTLITGHSDGVLRYSILI